MQYRFRWPPAALAVAVIGAGVSPFISAESAEGADPAPAATATRATPRGDAGTDGATPSPSPSTPPDPPPLTERRQWVFDLRYAKGDVTLTSVRAFDSEKPRETPRVMGRFALELFEGPTLVERVRFDFPMLGDDPQRDAGGVVGAGLSRGVITSIGVVFPATKRGVRLELWDRASGRRWPLPWPPRATSDAGLVP